MENKVLKWSCSRSKFIEMVSSKSNSFGEVLGYVSNILWKLEIRMSKVMYIDQISRFEDLKGTNINQEYSFKKWKFILKRNECNLDTKVSAKLISNNEVWDKEVHFVPSIKNLKIFEYNTMKMNNYCLDLIVIVQYNPEVEEGFQNLKSNNEKEIEIAKLHDLSAIFQAMLEKEHMTDVTLKCESIELKAHKSILSIQSPVFEAMFTSPMLERESSTVEIQDMDSSVFRDMINFMYSGKVKVKSEATIYGLMYAAEKYQIKSLKEGCVEYLRSILSCENALKVLEVSHLFDKQLKLHTLTFVKNHFEELKLSKEWEDLKLENTILAFDVYSYIDRE